MINLAGRKRVFLKPGEFFWGTSEYVVSTVLGSCVSICLWHPEKKVGGISHYRMPGRRKKKRNKLNPDYGDDSMWLLMEKVMENDTKPEEYIVKVFGGARMFDDDSQIGRANAEVAIERLTSNGFKVSVKNVGGKKSRKVLFDLKTGDVWLRDVLF